MGSVEILMQESVYKGLYLESRRIHRNWLGMSLVAVLLVRWIKIEAKGLGKAMWINDLSHVVYFFTRQHKKGKRAKRKDFKPVPEDWRPSQSRGHRSSESSGGWKIITGQFPNGIHADEKVLVD